MASTLCKIILVIAVAVLWIQVGNAKAYYNTGNLKTENIESNLEREQFSIGVITQDDRKYELSPERLAEVRSEFLYPFFEEGGPDGSGDYQKDIKDSTPQITKLLNFNLPFFGFRFNYTWVSLHGFLAHSHGPVVPPTYPLQFPVADYPVQSDPSFIGPFYSKCKIGELAMDEIDERSSGVYFRAETHLSSRTDPFGVELRERVTSDVREGIIGADKFTPEHVIIVTWKNVSFSGGTIHARKKTNTFQTVIVTDERRTYAIFNYHHMGWFSHTEAGGSSEDGTGGIPAFVGFNGGNGTGSYEYKPYSQAVNIQRLLLDGHVNGFPGRHIFRIDENIFPGQCNPNVGDLIVTPKLSIAPEGGNMLGGTIVNVTGPCFAEDSRVTCRFGGIPVPAVVVDRNRATCQMPPLKNNGYINLHVQVEGSDEINWTGKFFVNSPSTATELVFINQNQLHQKEPKELEIQWDSKNLALDLNLLVSINLWGYREDVATKIPELFHIDTLVNETYNDGRHTIHLTEFERIPAPWAAGLEIGLITVEVEPENFDSKVYPILWSRPIPLAWYFRPEWEKRYGTNQWVETICNNWIFNDVLLGDLADDNELPACPCNLEQALTDKGRFMPDPKCNRDDSSTNCNTHPSAIHCVRSSMATSTGGSQMCCYDANGRLILTTDQANGGGGGRPGRAHDFGQSPWNQLGQVPSLSHYLHDIHPVLPCCEWQDKSSPGCQSLRAERRRSQNCDGYQPPTVNQLSEPVVDANASEFLINTSKFVDIRRDFKQARSGNSEKDVVLSNFITISSTELFSSNVSIHLRDPDAQWRYKMDVYVDEQKIFFDTPAQKIQTFPGVTIYTPTTVSNQSHVITMYASGDGVEVIENNGIVTTRHYMPREPEESSTTLQTITTPATPATTVTTVTTFTTTPSSSAAGHLNIGIILFITTSLIIGF